MRQLRVGHETAADMRAVVGYKNAGTNLHHFEVAMLGSKMQRHHSLHRNMHMGHVHA